MHSFRSGFSSRAQQLQFFAKYLVSNIPRQTSNTVVSTLNSIPWTVVDALSVPWRRLDAIFGKYADGGFFPPTYKAGHHVALDVLISVLKSRSIFHPHGFYPKGIGKVHELATLLDDMVTSSHSDYKSVHDIDVTLTESIYSESHATVVNGSFPAPAITHLLPKESHVAYFELVTPKCWSSDYKIDEDNKDAELIKKFRDIRPIVILLPGTGEQGFRRRRHLVSYPLARLGIASLILEGPYYGSRRPPHQSYSKLETVVDLPFLGRATLSEACSLVAWLRQRTIDQAVNPLQVAESSTVESPTAEPPTAEPPTAEPPTAPCTVTVTATHATSTTTSSLPSYLRIGLPLQPSPTARPRNTLSPDRPLGATLPSAGGYGVQILAGTSMGGLHAAMSSTMLPPTWDDVGMVSWLGPSSASAVFTRARLAHGVDWNAIVADMLSREEDIERTVRHMESQVAAGAHTALPTVDDAKALHTSFPEIPVPLLHRAQTLIARMLNITDISNFGLPPRPDAALFVRALHDQYVPADASSEALWAELRRRWKGAGVEFLEGGHVSGAIFALDRYVEAVIRTIHAVLDRNENESTARD